jgi:3-methylcrotonyl-CoA carboxylase beta subunit
MGANYKEQWDQLLTAFSKEEANLRLGGGEKGISRQHRLGRLHARERIRLLIDSKEDFFELGIWQGFEMYPEWGEVPAAGVIAGIGKVSNRYCMIVANDATVKAGAFFPQTVKKVLRAQRLAFESNLPVIYLVDSSGVFLPLQDEIFPDEDDFGRIFRNNALFSSAGIPQFAAVMGNCIAGGGYLPVLCDQLLMTKGSGLYLAGPALVKAAIGQEVEAEELGGSQMHSSISGTVDFEEDDDPSCIDRLRSLMEKLNNDDSYPAYRHKFDETKSPLCAPESIYEWMDPKGSQEYDVRKLLDTIVDEGSIDEYKKDYGKTLVTAFATIAGIPVGIVASQRKCCENAKGGIEIGGVIYPQSAEKAARFIMECNQMQIPLIFLQDVFGFMVGRDAEQEGIIRSGAKLVNALSNTIVPKITVIIGNSYGAGNYALCGKAYDPRFIVAWPNSHYAVMGGAQAASTLLSVQKRAMERQGQEFDTQAIDELHQKIKDSYKKSENIRYAAARGWVDAVIQPCETRKSLVQMLRYVGRKPFPKASSFHTGVFQV